MEGKPSWI